MGDGFEPEVQALARQIAAAGAIERVRLFHLGRWSERVLDWAMSHPGFKTELFRFVDVFPACRDDADVLRHLSEYFAGVEVPRALGLGLEVAERVPFGARPPTAAARRNIMRMARQLIAGATPEDALPRLAALWRAGEACTVDLLGEKTVTEREAARYATRVRAMLDALVAGTREWPAAPHLERDPWGPVPRVHLSVKPTALSALFAPASARDGLAEARERLLPILRRAREAGATVHLDMEHDDVKDLTLELLRGLGAEFPDGPQLGCVIQAYRKDAFADLRAVVAWSERALRLPLAVRLVKGAYWDFETVVAAAEGWPVPVFEAKAETDASYERCVRHLVEHAGRVRPAFGSHNLRSIAYAVACARARGLPPAAVEHQLLYGMAEPVHAALRRLGFRVRVYAPVGDLVVGRGGRAGPEEAVRALAAAARAWPAWRATPWAGRAAVLFRAAAIMRRRRAELAALEVFEAGKPVAEADSDVCEAIDFCEYYGRAALRLGAGAPVLSPPGATNVYRSQPRGVGVVIAPWNFPLAIPAGMTPAALVAGNCVVLKPAEQTPGIAFRLVEILLAAGLPPGALAFLPGVGEEVGPALVDHPATAFVAFTGSRAVGLSLLERAAVHRPGQRHVKRVIAEMGGKNAIVVDADADLDQAVPAIVASALAYAG